MQVRLSAALVPATCKTDIVLLGLSPELAEELLEFGAIWIALPEPGSIPPRRCSVLASDQTLSGSKNQHGVGKTRRASRDEELPAGAQAARCADAR
eukprot:1309026-Rhodomonas_salina.1